MMASLRARKQARSQQIESMEQDKWRVIVQSYHIYLRAEAQAIPIPQQVRELFEVCIPESKRKLVSESE
jgi:hypothetical protein